MALLNEQFILKFGLKILEPQGVLINPRMFYLTIFCSEHYSIKKIWRPKPSLQYICGKCWSVSGLSHSHNLKCILGQPADHSLLVLRNEQVPKHLELFAFSQVNLSIKSVTC